MRATARPPEIGFPGPPSVPAGISNDEFNFQDSGRYRFKPGTARDFSYRCTYNTQSGMVASVVLRDAAAQAGQLGSLHLEGAGHAVRPPGHPSAHFRYRMNSIRAVAAGSLCRLAAYQRPAYQLASVQSAAKQ